MDLSSLTINLTPLSLHMRCEDEFSGLVHCWQGWGLKHSGFDRALEEGDVEYRPNLGLRRELQPVVLRQLVLVMAVLVLELQLPRRCCLQGPTPCEVIRFLSKSDEETTSNRKLAKEVDKWSRLIFNKSNRFEDMKTFEEERPYRRPPVKKVMSNAVGGASRDDDLDLAEFSQGRKSGPSSSRQHASTPEAKSMDFVIHPQSKVDPEAVRARAKQMVQDQRRTKVDSSFIIKMILDCKNQCFTKLNVDPNLRSFKKISYFLISCLSDDVRAE